MRATHTHVARWQRAGRALLVVALSCVVATSCGLVGGEAPSEASDTLARASTEEVAFAYPKGWSKLPPDAYPEGWAAAHGKEKSNQAPAQVAVYTRLPPTSDAQLALEALIAKFQFSHDFQRKKNRSIEVENAKSAWRMDYSYTAGNSKGNSGGSRVLGTDVAVVDQAGHAAVIRITRYPGAVKDNVVEDMVNRIVVKSGN